MAHNIVYGFTWTLAEVCLGLRASHWVYLTTLSRMAGSIAFGADDLVLKRGWRLFFPPNTT